MNWYNLLALATEHDVFIFKEVSEQSSFIFGYNNPKNSHKQLHTSEDLLSKNIRNICTYSTRVTHQSKISLKYETSTNHVSSVLKYSSHILE